MEIDNDCDSESEEEALSKYAKGSNRREEDNDSDSASEEATYVFTCVQRMLVRLKLPK